MVEMVDIEVAMVDVEVSIALISLHNNSSEKKKQFSVEEIRMHYVHSLKDFRFISLSDEPQ